MTALRDIVELLTNQFIFGEFKQHMESTNTQRNNSSNCFLIIKIVLLPLFLISLSACNLQSNNDAPVTNGWQDTTHAGSTYQVQKGETLYSIAWRYGLDYRKLVSINHIQAPYHLEEGQIIHVAPDNSDDTVTTYESESVETHGLGENQQMVYNTNSYNEAPPVTAPVTDSGNNQKIPTENVNAPAPVAVTTTAQPTTEQTGTPIEADYHSGPVTTWMWPVHGSVLSNYNGSSGINKGIDIAGHMGEPVHATAAGKVVYCGGGLRGYGQLVIIKHNDEYLSAYAHNSKLLVSEGQVVSSGQVIALMGNSEAQRVMLHFEIRRAGKPVDPLTYLSHS